MNATEYVRHRAFLAMFSVCEEFVKYSFHKNMKFNRLKCKQIVLRFNCHNKFPFFRKGSPSNSFFFVLMF